MLRIFGTNLTTTSTPIGISQNGFQKNRLTLLKWYLKHFNTVGGILVSISYKRTNTKNTLRYLKIERNTRHIFRHFVTNPSFTKQLINLTLVLKPYKA